MCVAFPGKVIKKRGEWAIVDFKGVKKKINISFVKVKKGDFVNVHAGFAIQKLDPQDAFEILKLYEERERNKRNNRKDS